MELTGFHQNFQGYLIKLANRVMNIKVLKPTPFDRDTEKTK